MKQIIFLIDVGNAKFLIEKIADKYKLPTLVNQKDIKNISNEFFLKYNIKIKEERMEILKDSDNYLLIKTYIDDFKNNKNYEYKILNDVYEIINDQIHKSILLDIIKKIFYESINDSFWLGIILTVEDKIEDYQMKNLLSSFLLSFSSIFCQETVQYKLGKIINPNLNTHINLKKMRNSYLKECPLYDSKKIQKIIKEMGIDFENDNKFDIVLSLYNDNLIDINSRNWDVNNSNDFETYNSIIVSPRRWVKNQLPEELNAWFEETRKIYIEEFIKKINKVKIKLMSYSAKKLFSINLSYDEKVYIMQRLGLIKTVKLISDIFGSGNYILKKDADSFYLDFDIFLIKVKATLIEMIWNDNKCNNIPFLNEILNDLPNELDNNFFIINRKCRDNIHYGFYNSISKEEYVLLEKNQNIYIDYIIEELNKKIIYVFDMKYKINIKLANFLHKFNN